MKFKSYLILSHVSLDIQLSKFYLAIIIKLNYTLFYYKFNVVKYIIKVIPVKI